MIQPFHPVSRPSIQVRPGRLLYLRRNLVALSMLLLSLAAYTLQATELQGAADRVRDGETTRLLAEAAGRDPSLPRIVLSGHRRQGPPAGTCGTALEKATTAAVSVGRQLPPDPGLSPGDPVYFDVEPTTIPLNRKVPVRIRNLMVLGDVPQIEVSLTDGAPVRRFERLETRDVDGHLVSVYDITFPRDDLRAGRLQAPIRFDHIDRGFRETTGYLRLRSAAIPKTRVVRINDRVQYSSHVVNIVVPWDGLSVFRLPGEQIAEEFYRHFTDSYEELAFVPARTYWSPNFGARHQFVYNDIEGIGLSLIDERRHYADSRVLRDWIFYIRGDLQSNFLSLHETGHNWGWFISLFDAAGVPLSGSTDCAGLEYDGTSVHAPVFGDEHTFLSQCLLSPLYISRRSDEWRITKAPRPFTYHPLMLYAMGLLDAGDVPPMYLGSDQGSMPGAEPGRRVRGEFTEVTMDDVLRHYGERRGPAVPPVWRRATIVVSPERLLSKKDLRWFNFFAKRISDPDVTGVESITGVPSIETATLGMVDVLTEIRPRSHPRIPGAFEVSYPQLGKRDIPGLKLKKKLETRFASGRSHILAGRVKKPEGLETISVRIGSKVVTAEIQADRRFSLPIELRREDRGPQWMTIWLGYFERVLARIAPVYVE
jgi:hypothetical protein